MLQLAEQEGGRWMAVSLLYFAASVALVIGLPAILTLFDRKGFRTGLTAVGVFTDRLRRHRRLRHAAGVLPGAGRDRRHRRRASIDAVGDEAGLAAVLLRLDRARSTSVSCCWRSRCSGRGTTAKWIPAVLLLHVALFPVSSLLPAELQSMTTLLITVATLRGRDHRQPARREGPSSTSTRYLRLARAARGLGALVGVQDDLADPDRVRA